MMTKRLLFAGLGLMAMASAASAQTLDGIWALDVEACGGPGFDPGTMVIDTAARTASFYESECTFDVLEPIGTQQSAWRAMLTCSGEGETWQAKSIFAIDAPFDGSPIRLVEIALEDGFVIGRYACTSSQE